MNPAKNPSSTGLAGRVAGMFIDSRLTPLVVIVSVLLGIGAILKLPREEEPQIKVPMIDVMVDLPGFTAKEVEQRATVPMEKLLWEIPGVEYIYSTSSPEHSLIIVRFKVGEDVERSIVKLTQKLESNFDRIPPGASFPIIKPRSIDDVPILALTFHSSHHDHLTLRRVAAEADKAVAQIEEVAETTLTGGETRQVRVLLDPARLAGHGIDASSLAAILEQWNTRTIAGDITSAGTDMRIETGEFIRSAAELGEVVVGIHDGRTVHLRDVAEIIDGAGEPKQYVLFGGGPDADSGELEEAAVTLSIAKRPGSNAVDVADQILRKVDQLKGVVIPDDMQVTVTRHYGETAAEKSNELLFHMAIAVVGVSLLILFALGWRESIVVATAIPTTLALTLLVFYLYGFTLNRITLFALIFSIGILVDDAIVVVENIVRHFRLPGNRSRPWNQIATEAVGEVGNPTILATFAVIAAVLPMAFVGGLMGPYMRPIPIGASAAMIFSMAIAFIVTPWAAVRVLRWLRKPADSSHHDAHEKDDLLTRLYRRIMDPLIHRGAWRWTFLGGITALLLGSMILVGTGWVKVKMLPFDNKSEFQVILNMPEGTPLEETTRVAREMAAAIRTEPEVMNYQIYAGTASPFNFNGLVRHYFLRRGAHVADIQVNLLPKHDRSAQGHDIAKRIRPRVAEIAEANGGRVAIAEVPPGPPVLQTLVAEIYGPDSDSRRALADEVRNIFKTTDGVVDVDWYREAPQQKTRFIVDREKAALHGIPASSISGLLSMAVAGQPVGLIHQPKEREEVTIVLEIPRHEKTSPDALLDLHIKSPDTGSLIALRELVEPVSETIESSIYHKNLLPVEYVLGDVAGTIESPVYAIAQMNAQLAELDAREHGANAPSLRILNANIPFSDLEPSMKWDGEWHITIEVFRDLGIAFGVVLILIFVLMVGWFRSFVTPLVVMIAIPFSLVGILPAHGAMGAFFTATSMIGFMAGAGIVVRNSIILVDFIEQRVAEGQLLHEAVVDAGAVRFRPMLLTAMAVVIGAGVILFDPIFQGLAISLMAGEIASLLISRMAVPVLYFMTANSRAKTKSGS